PFTPALKAAAILLACAGVGVAAWSLSTAPTPGESSVQGPAVPAAASLASGKESPALAAAGRDAAGPPARPSGGDVLAGSPSFAGVDRDLDLHGLVVRGDGTPVSGAVARAVTKPWKSVLGADPERYREEDEAGRATTGADGQFAIRLPRGAEVTLDVRASGLARNAIARCTAGERVRVVLGPAAALVVRTLDATGAPVADAAVEAWCEVRNTSETTPGPWRGATDASGALRFDDLPAGIEVGVTVRHAAWASPQPVRMRRLTGDETTVTLTMAAGRTVAGRVVDAESGAGLAGARVGVNANSSLWWMGAPTVSDAEGRFRVVGWAVGTGGELAADAVGYQRGAASVPREDADVEVKLLKGVTVAGRLVGADGRPVAGARMGVQSLGRDSFNVREGGRSGVSQPNGDFRIDGLPIEEPGTLMVVATGHARTTIDYAPSAAVAGMLDLGDVVLPRALRVEGTLRTVDGDPVTGTWVGLEGGSEDRGRRMPGGFSLAVDALAVHTDDMGRFRFEDVGPGYYEVHGTGFDRLPIRLDKADVLDVDLVVAAARQIGVRLSDSWGGGVEGCPVAVEAKDGSVWRTVTGPGGYVAIPVSPDATAVVADAAWAAAHGYRAPAPGSMPHPNWPQVALTLEFDGEVAGTVLDPGGSPLVGAQALVRMGERLFYLLTDASGRLRLRVPADTPVSIELTGYVYGRPATVAEGSKTRASADTSLRAIAGRLEGLKAGGPEFVLRARPLAEDRVLRALVLDADGEPLRDAKLQVEGRAAVALDATGRATLEGLPARPLRMTVELASDGWKQGWLQPNPEALEPDGRQHVLRLRRAARIEGIVVDPAGRPVPRVEVHVTQGPGTLTMSRSDAAGKVSIAVDPDRYFPLELTAFRASQGQAYLKGRVTLQRLPSGPLTLQLAHE
ncbi:MAG TPA: carboxypeptidase-like regulatory domain-containing protein, partial [Planctomycetota bacterium]|nr:carboxypeptidase-like regulatory domain-containing protein [Planctomycetota bacterium]